MIRPWFAGTAVIATVFCGTHLQIVGTAHASDLTQITCETSDRIDGSSAADARKKMNMAGYHHVSALKKGCDNYWHGMAVKDGAATHVSLAPTGLVQSEGD
jgi:hypothetical protein